MATHDEQAQDQPAPSEGLGANGPSAGIDPSIAAGPSVDGTSNPYFSNLLDRTLVDTTTSAGTAGPTTSMLGTHRLVVRPDPRTASVVIEGYDNLGPSRTPRSLLRLSCGLMFGIGDEPATTCATGAIHILDDALLFVGGNGSIGPTELAKGAHYLLVAPPDLVVAIERRVVVNDSQRRELAGFRVVLVNPIQYEPLVITAVGLDQRALAMLVAAGETFMRDQVGSNAGWRPLGDGWETKEWNGSPEVSAPGPASAAAPATFTAPDAGATAAEAPSVPGPAASVTSAPSSTAPETPASSSAPSGPSTAAPEVPRMITVPEDRLPSSDTAPAPRMLTVPATTQASLDDTVTEADEPSGRWRRPVAAIVLAALAVGGVAAVVAGSRGDNDTEAAATTGEPSTETDGSTDDVASSTTETTTTTTMPTTTTTTATTTTETTTTTIETTTTAPTGPAPASESQQLAVWGFTAPAELASPSGEADCPPGEPSGTATVVGVNAALNVRDGADSSFPIVQRLVLGYDEVEVYTNATAISNRGTRWVTISLAVPPGTAADTARRCGWVATQFLDIDGA